MAYKSIYNVTEREVYAKGDEREYRDQYYAWVAYDKDGDFAEARPSGDSANFSVRTLKKKGFVYIDTEYYYINDAGETVQFNSLDEGPVAFMQQHFCSKNQLSA